MPESTPHSRARDAIISIGPRAGTVVCASLAVLTAYAMGWDWLQRTFLYIPLGLWAVALAGLAAQYRHQTLHTRQVESAHVPERRRFELLSMRSARMPRISRPRLPSASTVSGVLELVGVPSDSLLHARRRFESLGSRVAAHGRTLRIGIDLSEADARTLTDCGRREEGPADTIDIDWVRVPAGLVTEVEKDMSASGLDVLIRRERRGDINVFIREDPDHPAAWQDWGTPLPLGYPAVFPQRVDPARVALTGCDLADDLHARLATQMVLASAMMSRLPGRAAAAGTPGGTRTRLATLVGARVPMPELVEPDGPLCRLMQRMSMTLETLAAERPESAPLFASAAARVLGAWLTRENPGLAAEQRARVVAAAADLTPQESEGQLRLAAACFAAGHETEALAAVTSAAAGLRRTGRRCDADPLAFVMSEVELGQPDALTLGRVAAGLALLWATSPEQNLQYLREDLLDDLSHAGWLAKRPADVDLLQRVLKTLDGGTGKRDQRAAA